MNDLLVVQVLIRIPLGPILGGNQQRGNPKKSDCTEILTMCKHLLPETTGVFTSIFRNLRDLLSEPVRRETGQHKSNDAGETTAGVHHRTCL